MEICDTRDTHMHIYYINLLQKRRNELVNAGGGGHERLDTEGRTERGPNCFVYAV